ncbi:MAG: PD-(D/E)XK nuclease family protein [Acidimicrobiales bacterium]
MVSVTTTSAGAAAVDALGKRLGELRGDSPLSPAVVLCQSPVMAVGLRRALARRPQGIAGVRFTTINQFAEEIATPELIAAGLRTARKAEVSAAIRAELHAGPGRFGRVADHRTTEDRLAAFHEELVGLPEEVLDRLAADAVGLSEDALRVVRAASARMGRACGGDRLIAVALEELDRLKPFALGPLILYFPEPLRPYEGRIVQALARRSDCEVIVGLTGLAATDERHLGRLAGWSIQLTETTRREVMIDPARATVLDVADPEEEVRAALRELTAHAAAGVPLTDMALLYASAQPYAQLLADHLEGAGLPYCGPGHRPLANSLPGRTLRRLLSLSTRGLEREAVITLVSAAPIDDGHGNEVPAASWDRLSRQAGVIDGEHWLPRLAELAGGAEDDGSKRSTVALSHFVEELEANLQPPEERTWARWSTWAVELLDRYLLTTSDPADPEGITWPASEIEAFARLKVRLAALVHLDEFGQPPTLDTFESTVVNELGSAVIPGHPLGTGVYVGPVDSVPGLGFERITVVGLSEGSFPRTPREDSLLPDQLRAAGAGMLIEKSAITDVDIRAVALASASSRRPALLLTSRGDLRSNRSRSWPRALAGLVENRLSLDSHYQGLIDHGRPAGIDDFGLRALIGHVDNDNPVQTHELAAADPVLAANLARVGNRSRSEMTRHAGRVPAGQFDPTERLLSPTALETYASCPRKYLFQRVLRLGEDERPERIDEITARDRGTLIHSVLERFISDALADNDVPAPGEPWSVERRLHLFDLLEQEIKSAATRGVTGGQVKTKLLHRALYNELLDFLDTDDELRAQRRSVPFAAEYSFGFADSPALEGLWAGRRMQLRGSVDRVDLTEDGGLLVIDYKGGSKRPFEGMEANPLNDGRRLQLPLYARAVAERLDRSGERTGLYWLTKVNEIKEMVLDDALESDLEDAVGAALDGIGEGVFPGVPGEVVGWPRLSFENCKYCDFDRICPTDRQSEWERVRSDTALMPIDLLLGRLNDALTDETVPTASGPKLTVVPDIS